MSFMEKLRLKWDEDKFVCVGLDSDAGKLPASVQKQYSSTTMPTSYMGNHVSPQAGFNMAIVDATKDLVCAYKPNSAFYEAHGKAGIEALEVTVSYIDDVAPDVPVILDAKRADIGNTNNGYVEFALEYLGADAITVHPYLGSEAMRPFLDRTDKGIIVLCRTSNPGAGEFQDLRMTLQGDPDKPYNNDEFEQTLYQMVARSVSSTWDYNGNCALVVGATYPRELAEVRKIIGDMPILIPGIGAQGGEVEATVKAGQDSKGQGMIINSSRGIIFASSGEDFAEVARAKTLELHGQINQYRQA